MDSSKSNQYVYGIGGGTGCPQHKDRSCYACHRQLLLSRGAWQEFPAVFRHENGPRTPRPPQCRGKAQCWRSFLPRICYLQRRTGLPRVFDHLLDSQTRTRRRGGGFPCLAISELMGKLQFWSMEVIFPTATISFSPSKSPKEKKLRFVKFLRINSDPLTREVFKLKVSKCVF